LSLPAQTLHDFVLNLLTDDAARSAFAADPTAALESAGLSDVTPQDIQEVAPLVADYAPAPAADALESVLSSLPAGAGASELQNAIAQLTAVAGAADALPQTSTGERSLPVSAPELPVALPELGGLPVALPSLSGLPVALPSLGDLPVAAPSLGGLPVAIPDLGSLPTGDLPVAAPSLGDLPLSDLPLDAPKLDGLPLAAPDLGGLPVAAPSLGDLPVSAPDLGSLPTGDLPVAAPSLGDLPLSDLPTGLPLDAPKLDGLPLDAPQVNTLPVTAPNLSLPEAGKVQTATSSTTDSFTGTLAYSGDEAASAAGATASTENVALAGAADSQVGTVTGSGIAGTDAFASGLQTESAFGSYSVGTEGTPGTVPSFGSLGDLGDSLDSDALAKSAPAAGTLADYVSSGGALLSEPLTTGTSTLGGYLTGFGPSAGPDANLAHAVDTAGAQVGDGIDQATTTTSEQASHLPATPALPAVPSELPTHLPADLPVHVSAELPQSLPHLPVANPLPAAGDLGHVVTDNPVTDTVSHSPLGDTTSPLDHSALSEAPSLDSLHSDLPFGH
jgi:hypothetical protein